MSNLFTCAYALGLFTCAYTINARTSEYSLEDITLWKLTEGGFVKQAEDGTIKKLDHA